MDPVPSDPSSIQTVAELKSLDGSVVRYNQLAHRLKLVPASAKRADGVMYEMRINREAAVPSELSNLDLKVGATCCASRM
jgi:kinetochore protein NDC80